MAQIASKLHELSPWKPSFPGLVGQPWQLKSTSQILTWSAHDCEGLTYSEYPNSLPVRHDCSRSLLDPPRVGSREQLGKWRRFRDFDFHPKSELLLTFVVIGFSVSVLLKLLVVLSIRIFKVEVGRIWTVRGFRTRRPTKQVTVDAFSERFSTAWVHLIIFPQ